MATATIQSADVLIDAFVMEVGRSGQFLLHIDPADFEAGRAILELPREQQIEVVCEVAARQARGSSSMVIRPLLQALLRKKLPFTLAHLEQLVQRMADARGSEWWWSLPPAGILRAIEEQAGTQGIPESLAGALRRLADKLRQDLTYADGRKILQRIETLLGTLARPAENCHGPDASPILAVRRPRVEPATDEAWTRCLRSALGKMKESSRAPWDGLLAHCATATASKPSKKWLGQVQALIETAGREAFAGILGEVLAEIGKPGTAPARIACGFPMATDPTLIHEEHCDLLRGLVWSASLVPGDALITAVGDAADVCFKKIPNIGPRAPKIGNACLWVLSSLSTTAAVAQLSRLKTRAKHVSIRKQLDKALDTAAEKTGMTAAELEEVAVPTCGLTTVGERRQQFGDFTAVLRVADGFRAEITWHKPDGKTQQSIPAAVKAACGADVKALQSREKEIAKLLPAQRARLEQLLQQQRDWRLDDFQTRFLDHPLVGTLARRLIWRFRRDGRQADGSWHAGRIVDERDRPLDWLDDATRVSPWHPLHATVEQVQAWREWLEAHEVRQPFKQAHREIYLLTDAERQTGIYSNRFAAQVIRQHQFSALCQQRGWRFHLQGEWDSANTPTLMLPQWDMRAEFWVHPIHGEGPIFERGDLTHATIYLYMSTDQVRFYRAEEALPLLLSEVPPLVFCEVMRDVDLFVGVAGVGNDPTWSDGGLLGHWGEVWQGMAFGDLFPSGQTRKAVLERIIPRLKIAERCSFSEKYLIVRGQLRTYKIHLGSGNILMSPNDQYLCIVSKPGDLTPGGKVHLPFEGDNLLSIILSKAFLLADDQSIKDPTIVNQLRHNQ